MIGPLFLRLRTICNFRAPSYVYYRSCIFPDTPPFVAVTASAIRISIFKRRLFSSLQHLYASASCHVLNYQSSAPWYMPPLRSSIL
jgi:hypothetical protein